MTGDEGGRAEAVVTAILGLAKQKAEEKIEEARIRAEEIVEEARRQAEEIIRSRRERAEREMRDELSRRESAAELEAKKIIMRIKAEYIKKAFDAAREELAAVSSGKRAEYDYRVIIKGLARQAIESINSGSVVIMGRDADLEILREVAAELEQEMGVKVEVDRRGLNTIGGVVVRDEEDTVRYYNTFEGRLRRVWEEGYGDILEILFG